VDPAAACKALSDYVRLIHVRRGSACGCGATVWPARAVGTYRGRSLDIGLDGCCLGDTATTDEAVLLPALGA
jgi:hypothetical protein